MINYAEINIHPSDRIEVAFRKVVRYMVPDAPSDVIFKVANLVIRDKKYRPQVLRVIINSLEEWDKKQARK